MYKPKYFKIKEFIPKELHNLSDWQMLLCIDDRILKASDIIRGIYGPCIVNGNGLDYCGFRLDRPIDSVGQHYFGRACDLHILSIENQKLSKEDKIKAYDKVRNELRKLKEFENIRLEWGISWLHLDFGNSENINFYPKK